MSIKEQIQFLNDTVKVKLASSKIHGVGVVAMRNIRKGDRLYCFPNTRPYWFTLTYANLTKLLPEIRELILERWPSVVDGSHFLSPNDMSWLICFLNHSDDPNYDPKTDTATRDIKKGEEIFENYLANMKTEQDIEKYAKIYSFLRKNA